MPERAEQALSKTQIVKELGIKPWNFDKLTAKDLQDFRLGFHAETYIQEQQQDRAQHGNSLSKDNYDVGKSRKEAFGVE